MEGNCSTCSELEGEALCLGKLKELIVNYEQRKHTDVDFAVVGENFGGRLLQFHQSDSLEEFLKVKIFFNYKNFLV
jgi:hypothetical protein